MYIRPNLTGVALRKSIAVSNNFVAVLTSHNFISLRRSAGRRMLRAFGLLGMVGLLTVAAVSASETAPAATPAPAAAPASAAPATAPASTAAKPAPTAAPATAPVATTAKPAADSAKTVKKAKSKKSKAVKDSTAAAAAAKDSAKAVAAPAALKDSSKTATAPVLKDSAASKDTSKSAARTVRADSLKTPVAVVDSAKNIIGDTTKAAPAVATTVDSSAYADSSQAGGKKKRKRVVRETTVNTIDELKGRYRSPKKALFMSMIVPGLGQAYVGHTWTNYARGAAYFLTDVALAYGWHYYVVDRQDAQIAKYQKFADLNWRQFKYEDSIAKDTKKTDARNSHRENYCETVQENETPKGNSLFLGCKTPGSDEYQSFHNEYNDKDWNNTNPDSVGIRRSQFPNPHNFYELIGKENEFITGWSDADSVYMGDSAFYAMGADGLPLKDAANQLILATTPMQQRYIGMRAQANTYARMQAYFLGGMVVNHIVSAIDAALSAHYHNKALYQTETNWWDRIRLDSQMAWDGYAPTPTVTASLTF